MDRSGSHLRTLPPRPRVSRGGATLVLGALLLLQSVVGGEALATVWRQDGFTGNHQSYNKHETTITAANVATLVERWRTPDVGAINAPQVANGRLFVTTGADAVALATDDGHELWRKSPTEIDDCGLYDHALTPDGKLTVALGCIFGGGTLEFDVATGASNTPGFVFHTGNLNYVVRGDDVFWLSYQYGSGGPLAVQLVGYPGLVYFGGLDTLYLSGPTVLGDQLFVGINAGLQAFDLNACPNPIPVLNACGTQWAKTLPGRATTPVGFRGDQVAVASIDGTLGVYDATTGDLLWTGHAPSGVVHPPAIARQRIFLPGKRGVIHVFDAAGCGAATCMQVGRYKPGSPVTAQPVVAGDVLYVGTRDGRLVAFAADGCGTAACAPLWSVDVGGGAIVSGPVVVDGVVYAGTADGQFVAYGLPAM